MSLDGALGKIALRSRSAPRQLLQVTPSNSSNNIAEAAGSTAKPATQKPALTQRQVLLALEKLYSLVLEMEQVKRLQTGLTVAASNDPSVNAELEENRARYTQLGQELWQTLCATEPLDIRLVSTTYSSPVVYRSTASHTRSSHYSAQQKGRSCYPELCAIPVPNSPSPCSRSCWLRLPNWTSSGMRRSWTHRPRTLPLYATSQSETAISFCRLSSPDSCPCSNGFPSESSLACFRS